MEHTFSKATILIVEDNDVESAILRTTLQHVGQLVFVSTIQQAEQALANETFSMVITDVNLPDGDGFSLIKKIRGERKTSDTPVFVLTGRTAVDDRVAGFALGADESEESRIVAGYNAAMWFARLILLTWSSLS